MGTLDLLLPVAALVFLSVLLLRPIRNNSFWRASITPLASIIGSGFLVIGPLLGEIIGPMMSWAMILIVAFAYLIGSVIRFNIRHAEPLFTSGTASSWQQFVEHVSNLGLLGAYIISVAFYLRLMSAFVLRGLGMLTETNANELTSSVLLLIGITGWRHGLKGLERLESYSVAIKLAIIGSFLLGLGLHDSSSGFLGDVPQPHDRPAMETLRLLAGMLLVVQGFETSRYLQREYSAKTRVRSMQFAQAIAALIYVGFGFLILPLLHFLAPGRLNETGIIDLSSHVSVTMPIMLIVAAAMSQFSAAIADTLGGGGLISEESRTTLSPGWGYLIIAAGAIALVWSTSIFEIIAYASRAFAFYYFAQTVLALLVAINLPNSQRKWLLLTGLGLMSGILAWVTLYAIPAG